MLSNKYSTLAHKSQRIESTVVSDVIHPEYLGTKIRPLFWHGFSEDPSMKDKNIPAKVVLSHILCYNVIVSKLVSISEKNLLNLIPHEIFSQCPQNVNIFLQPDRDNISLC